ncbi:MAG TPA: glycosyltransferase [Gemmatales bacterium]|nr:glycosyltransferase [Gemmatales bacterium]
MPSETRIQVGFVLHVMQVAGAEVLVAEIIRRLRDQIAPTIFCLDAIGPLGEQLLQEGVPVIPLQRKPGRDWGLGQRLAALATQHQIQVMHAHQYTPFFYAALAKWRGRAHYKLILTEHGRHYPDIVSWKRRLFNRLLLARQLDAINACCQFSADALQKNDGFTALPIEVIENGIAFHRYQSQPDKFALRQKLGLLPERKYIACVARFHPIKDHTTLLQGFAELARHRSDADLLLLGDGTLRAQAEALAAQCNISHRVKFLGVRSDVPDWLQAVDIFTLTSLCEAASLTLLEAMAAGLPVVVTNVGGNPEIVRQAQEGLLVPRQNPLALAQAFQQLLQEPEQATTMGQRGRERVKEYYTLERTIQRYHMLYRKLAGVLA